MSSSEILIVAAVQHVLVSLTCCATSIDLLALVSLVELLLHAEF